MRRVTDQHPIAIDELRIMAKERFGDLVKGVVDIERGILLLDADLQADQEAELLAEGSSQRDREVVVDFFAGPNEYGSTAESLMKYFDAYALAARRASS